MTNTLSAEAAPAKARRERITVTVDLSSSESEMLDEMTNLDLVGVTTRSNVARGAMLLGLSALLKQRRDALRWLKQSVYPDTRKHWPARINRISAYLSAELGAVMNAKVARAGTLGGIPLFRALGPPDRAGKPLMVNAFIASNATQRKRMKKEVEEVQ